MSLLVIAAAILGLALCPLILAGAAALIAASDADRAAGRDDAGEGR